MAKLTTPQSARFRRLLDALFTIHAGDVGRSGSIAERALIAAGLADCFGRLTTDGRAWYDACITQRTGDSNLLAAARQGGTVSHSHTKASPSN